MRRVGCILREPSWRWRVSHRHGAIEVSVSGTREFFQASDDYYNKADSKRVTMTDTDEIIMTRSNEEVVTEFTKSTELRQQGWLPVRGDVPPGHRGVWPLPKELLSGIRHARASVPQSARSDKKR